MAINTSGVVAGDAVWNITGTDVGLKRALDGAETTVKSKFAGMSRVAGVAMAAVGGAITGAFGMAVKEATTFGTSMAEVASLGVKDLDGLEESVREIARAYGLDLTDAAKATYQAISAGASEMEVPKLLEAAAIAATAGVSDLTTAIGLGTSVTNAFGKEIGDVSSIYDEAFVAVKLGVTNFNELGGSVGKLAPIFSAVGLSSEELFGAVAALTKGGIATKESISALKAAMANVIKPGKEAAKMAEALDIEFSAASLQAKGFAGFMEMIGTAAEGDTEKMAQLFGSVEGLNAMLALTGSQAGSLADIMDVMKDKTGKAQEAFDLIVENDPAFAWRVLKAEMTDLAVSIGQSLLPTMKRLVDFLGPVVKWVGEFARENAGLTSKIVIAIAALGGLLLVLSPLALIVTPIISLMGLFAGPAALGGVGVAAGAAGVGIAGLAASILPLIAAVAVVVGAIWALDAAYAQVHESVLQLEESQRRLTTTEETYNATLSDRINLTRQAAMEEMTFAERTAFRADLEKETADGMLRAWIEHYAGRVETEQEFARARNLLLNEFLTDQQAALIATSDLSDEMVTKFVTATEIETQVMLETFGIGKKAALETNDVITQSSLDAASSREQAWIDSTHNIVAEEARAAQEAQSIWSSAWDWIRGLWGGGPQPPMPPAQPQGFAAGGVVGVDTQAFRMNERGGEIAIAPVGTRILSHGESVSVARDAITAAMAGMGGMSGGGGGRTVNIDMHVGSMVVREEADIGRITRALGDEIARRGQTAGVR